MRTLREEIAQTTSELLEKQEIIETLEKEHRENASKWDVEREKLLQDLNQSQEQCQTLEESIHRLKNDLESQAILVQNKNQVSGESM